MLYLINKDTPVIGVRNGASAIILTGYDESHVPYVDSENRDAGRDGSDHAEQRQCICGISEEGRRVK